MSEENEVQETNEQEREAQTQEQEAQGQQFDIEYVRKLRAEAAEYRKKLRELEGKLKADEEAKLSQTDKLQKQLADKEREKSELERRYQESTLRYEVMLAASKLGIVDPEAAWRLLDAAEIEYDDQGQPQQVEKMLQTLISKKPYLVASGGSSGATNPARASQLTREQIEKMSPAEINRRWDEVQKVLESSGQ